MLKKSFILINIVFFFISFVKLSSSMDKNMLEKPMKEKMIKPLKDNYCNDKNLILYMLDLGISLNFELYPQIMGEDDKRKNPIIPYIYSSKDQKIVDCLNHYVNQFSNEYRMEYILGQITLLPKLITPKCETIEILPYRLSGCSLKSMYADILKQLKSEGIIFYLPIFIGDNLFHWDEMKFDLTFKGGDLKEFLTSICNAMSEADPSHSYCWVGTGNKQIMNFSILLVNPITAD